MRQVAPADPPSLDDGPTGLELATGMVWGTDPAATPLPTAGAGSPRTALEEVLRRALLRPPCVVSFSGGRDSSALLAIATHVARRDGLAPPVPVTLRFVGAPDTDEDSWQESVVRHLGLDEWSRLVLRDELDIVGPAAQALLRRFGLLWPANVHTQVPVAAEARGGSVVTGFGGDELFTPHPLHMRVNLLLAGRARPRCRDVLRLAAVFGPAPVRRAAVRRQLADEPARRWLRPAAERAATAEAVTNLLHQPLRWDDVLDRGWWRSRYRATAERSLQKVVSLHGAVAVHPFAEPLVLDALARDGGRVGYPSRAAALRHLVGDLLPDDVLTRTSKASFMEAFWSRYSTAFVDDWDGGGVDAGLVDVDELRRMWTDPEAERDYRTCLLLQSAWLAAQAPRPEPADGQAGSCSSSTVAASSADSQRRGRR